MIVAGIDPGLKGAIAFVKNKKARVHLFPVIKSTKMKRNKKSGKIKPTVSYEIDGPKLCKLFEKYKIKHVFIEKVHAMPKQGVTSMFNFGVGWGLLRGICNGLHLPYTLVTPQEWKKVICPKMKKGSKDVSIIVAKKLWPKINLLPTPRCKKYSDGMADALCIAEYGKRILLGGI